MEKAHSYRFYLTPEQDNLLRRTLGCVRLVYNKALHERIQGWLRTAGENWIQRNVFHVDSLETRGGTCFSQ